MKKFVTIAIFFLFIIMCVVSSSGNLISSKSINRGVTISFNPEEPNGENGWYVTTVFVQFNADSGTIIVSIAISIDDGPLQTIQNNFEIYLEGEHNYFFLVTDADGNTYPFGPYEIKIDTFSPLIYLAMQFCGNIFTGRYILVNVWCEDYIHEYGNSGMSHVVFYMNETVQKVDDTSPYTWILKWPYPPPISFLKGVAYDNAGNSEQDELGYSSPWEMSIIGFIRNPEIKGEYLKFHANFVITFGYFGIIRNKDIIFEIFDYEGTIKDHFINAKIRGWWIPIYKISKSPYPFSI